MDKLVNFLEIARRLPKTEEDEKKQQEWVERNTLILQMSAQVMVENKTI